MNANEHREITALLSLLEDPDEEVQAAVSNRFTEMGQSAISVLENSRESAFKPELQSRIQDLLKTIRINGLYKEMELWRKAGSTNLLEAAWIISRFRHPDSDFFRLEQWMEKTRRAIWLELNSQLTALEKVRVINYFLYDREGFRKGQNKKDSGSLYMIDSVLESKTGSPVVLGLLYAELARRLDLPVYGVNLPGNFILCYYNPEYRDDFDGILFYINPADKGSELGRSEVRHFLKQIGMEPRPDYFRPCANAEIIERLLLNLSFIYKQRADLSSAVAIEGFLKKA